jgi:hypothetical protein
MWLMDNALSLCKSLEGADCKKQLKLLFCTIWNLSWQKNVVFLNQKQFRYWRPLHRNEPGWTHLIDVWKSFLSDFHKHQKTPPTIKDLHVQCCSNEIIPPLFKSSARAIPQIPHGSKLCDLKLKRGVCQLNIF